MEKVKEQKANVVKVFNILLMIAGLIAIAAGVMGCYWGIKIIIAWGIWPLTKLNNLASGLFMLSVSFGSGRGPSAATVRL